MGIRFAYESLKHLKDVGTITQSSSFLANSIAIEVVGENVVELGAGTGKVTRKILNHLSSKSLLTCFEKNPVFCDYLNQIKDFRLRVVNDDAENLLKHVGDFDTIVSGLPLLLMNEYKRDRILEYSKKAKRFIQLHYNPFSKRIYEEYFSDVKIKIELLNIPPAFVYVCENHSQQALKT